MGGKSRKTGSISRKLIERLKSSLGEKGEKKKEKKIVFFEDLGEE